MTELERLNLFVEQAEELGSRSYVSANNKPTWNFKWTRDEGSSSILVDPPDEDQLRSFVVNFRLFWMNDDPASLNRICNILLRRLPEGELRDIVGASKERVSKVRRHAKMQMVMGSKDDLKKLEENPLAELGGTPITPEELIDLWINSVFHNDVQKRKTLKNIADTFGQLADFTFIDTMNAITNQIGVIRGVIKDALVAHPTIFEGAKEYIQRDIR